jgi:glycosyltransferase involved in cell wall biosynthesis
MAARNQLITIFTPSFADESNTNAQNLTVKEIVARLPPELFRVIMINADCPDPRLAARPHTEFVHWEKHGNSAILINKIVRSRPNIYFFPRYGLLDQIFYKLRKYLRLQISLVTYVVMTMADAVAREFAKPSIMEADRLCANSRYVATTISECFRRDSEVIHDGVDERFFFAVEQRNISAPPIVLYAGSFQPRKRVELVISQAIRWPSVQFRLLGEGGTLAGCRTLTERYGCNNVTFLGHLSPERVGEEMRRANIFLFPSVVEGHPQVLLQAAACGLPVIAMSYYQPEYVVDRQTGFLANSDAELGPCLDALLTNTELRQSMSAAAVRHSRQFNWMTIAQQWADIFLEAAETQVVAQRSRKLTA